MSERDLDQALVERVQRGDKTAFDLLVSKYQRKLSLRLQLSHNSPCRPIMRRIKGGFS